MLLALALLLGLGLISCDRPNSTEPEAVETAIANPTVVAVGRLGPVGGVIKLSVPNAADSRVNQILVVKLKIASLSLNSPRLLKSLDRRSLRPTATQSRIKRNSPSMPKTKTPTTANQTGGSKSATQIVSPGNASDEACAASAKLT